MWGGLGEFGHTTDKPWISPQTHFLPLSIPSLSSLSIRQGMDIYCTGLKGNPLSAVRFQWRFYVLAVRSADPITFKENNLKHYALTIHYEESF